MSNCKRLIGKVAIVTASTEGIGFAIAKRLLDEGANVVISSRKDANVEKALKSLSEYGQSVHGVQCHVAKKEDRERLLSVTVQRYNRLDIMVSNAAVNPFMGNLMDTTEEVWTKIFEVNVAASFLLLKEATPLLRQNGGGSVVFVSSIAGFNPSPLLGAYSISKTALLGLCKAASFELASDNIRVNCVAPGIIQTKFSRALHQSEVASQAAMASIPMARIGQSPEIAGVVAFLVSNDASYVTGENIVASGGMLSRL